MLTTVEEDVALTDNEFEADVEPDEAEGDSDVEIVTPPPTTGELILTPKEKPPTHKDPKDQPWIRKQQRLVKVSGPLWPTFQSCAVLFNLYQKK